MLILVLKDTNYTLILILIMKDTYHILILILVLKREILF